MHGWDSPISFHCRRFLCSFVADLTVESKMSRAKLYLSKAVVALLVAGGLFEAHAEVLIATNSIWAYRKGTNEASTPANAWRALTFNDSSWTTGAAPFYYDAENVYR